MSKPLVAIVGRPNTGKSTFFNRIVGERISIVKDTPGVTRDRIYADAEWTGHVFTLVDTGGIEPVSDEVIPRHARMQAELAMDTAEVILFFVDAKDGMTAADEEVAHMLRRTKKPVIVVVNKTDSKKDEASMYEFYSLGFDQLFSISSSQGLGLGDLLDAVIGYFGETDEAEESDAVKVAIVGRPNVGKSSLTNKILGQDRVIVSEIAGTTRDAIDTRVTRNGREYIIIDTAGMRKKGRIEDESIERYSVVRALAAVERADVVVLMIDAVDGIAEQDVRIGGYVESCGKPCVIAVNKWDAKEKETNTAHEFDLDIREDFKFMSYASTCYISALTGQRVDKLFELCESALENSRRRITTGILNDTLSTAVTASEPPSKNGRRLRIYYSSQVAVCPPKFLLFVNDPELMHFSYLRYLENYIRKTFDFSGTPIRLTVRSKNERDKDEIKKG